MGEGSKNIFQGGGAIISVSIFFKLHGLNLSVAFFFQEYENNINEIVNMLDRNRSGTIDLKELEALYPDAAHCLLNRFDFDHSGDLSIKELKTLINSNKLASEILNKLKGRVNFHSFPPPQHKM